MQAQDEVQDRRSRIGLQMFRTMLAADLDLASKAGPDGQLRLLLVYRDDAAAAQAYAQELKQSGRGEQQGRIREWPIAVELANDLRHAPAASPAGVYIVQDLPDAQLAGWIEFGVARRIIVFSSVEGHVERGVLGGLDVGVRTLPYVNDGTLQRSQIRLKDLFLKIAKHHE